jgi:hypothetical protein
LSELIDLLHDHHFLFPANLEEVKQLTPYAAEFRYTELPAQPPFDRSWALDIVRRVKAWAKAVVRA